MGLTGHIRWYKVKSGRLLRSSQVGRLLRLRQLAFGICNLSETNVRKTSDTTKSAYYRPYFYCNLSFSIEPRKQKLQKIAKKVQLLRLPK